MAEQPFPDQETGSADDDLLALHRMESAAVRAALQSPSAITPARLDAIRYLLAFARLTEFRVKRKDVDAGAGLEDFRRRVVEDFDGPLRRERNAKNRLRRAAVAYDELRDELAAQRKRILGRDICSAKQLDAEVGTRALVNVAGGGGGAGFVYLGAYRRLEEAGVVPDYVIGSSIGALLGVFRARTKTPDWDAYIALARSLDRRSLFSAPGRRRHHGLPGLLGLDLDAALGQWFLHDDGSPLRIGDLELKYDAVVAGVRSRSFEQLPRRFRTTRQPSGGATPTTRFSPVKLAPAVASRMWQVALFFDPRVVKPVVLGSDKLTAGVDALDAAGFSAAIPGVLHYELHHDDARTAKILDELFERDELAALVDGGVVANVPAEIAWQQVRAGRLGTRNAVYVAFDCFNPRWDPSHLWLRPITQAIALQMTRNAPYADWVVRFEQTLSPVNLVPDAESLDRAIGWGSDAIEKALPLIEALVAPVACPV